ncbi:MAG: sugar phosphate isomerase/epimerase [Bryobacteraceae bacterium]
MKPTRREFAAAAAGALMAAPLGLPIGCQTYPVRKAIEADFDGALRQLAAAGFQAIELCSPHGYIKEGFGALADQDPREVRRRIEAAGLRCESSHYKPAEFQPDAIGRTIEYARGLGLKQMVLATFSLRNATLERWIARAGEINRAAEEIHKAGMQTIFHNHNVEFEKLDGALIYDRLLAELDPKLVKMQFQVWVVSMGVDPVATLRKLGNRAASLHLQDYDPATKGMTAIGKGSIDWKVLFGVAREAGVKNYFVEMDLPLMEASVPFLRRLRS